MKPRKPIAWRRRSPRREYGYAKQLLQLLQLQREFITAVKSGQARTTQIERLS